MQFMLFWTRNGGGREQGGVRWLKRVTSRVEKAAESLIWLKFERLVGHGSGIGGNADPVSFLENPSIDKSFASNVGLSAALAPSSEDPSRDRGLAVDVDAQGFGSHLFFIGGGGFFNGGQKLGLGFD